MVLREISVVIIVVMIVFSAAIGWSAALITCEDDYFQENCEDVIDESITKWVYNETRVKSKKENRKSIGRDESWEAS
jgi:hypothetical protein